MMSHAKEWGASDRPFNLQVQGSSLRLASPGAIQAITLKRSDQQDYANRLAQLEQSLTANDVGQLPDD